jgi:hypothetical protein
MDNCFFRILIISCILVTTGFVLSCDNDSNSSNRTATPSFSPPDGIYSLPQTVVISTTTPGATIKYTVGPTGDQTPPTSDNSAGIVYTQPLDISETTTIHTVCFKTGMLESVASATYIITQCDCQNTLFCYDFETNDLFGICAGYWETDDNNYTSREVLPNAGQNGSFGLTLIGSSNRGRDGLFHYLSNLTPSEIGFYAATMTTTGNTGYFSLSQSISGTTHYGIVFHFGSNGMMVVNNVAYDAYQISRYYHIEFKNIQWNGISSESTFDFYVDDTLVAEDVAFQDSGLTGFSFLMIYNLDTTQVWYDDIVMLP